MTDVGVMADLAITSPAIRARETLDAARKAGQWATPIEENRILYEGGVNGRINPLRAIDPRVPGPQVARIRPGQTWTVMTPRYLYVDVSRSPLPTRSGERVAVGGGPVAFRKKR